MIMEGYMREVGIKIKGQVMVSKNTAIQTLMKECSRKERLMVMALINGKTEKHIKESGLTDKEVALGNGLVNIILLYIIISLDSFGE
jgi:hypothetical protein